MDFDEDLAGPDVTSKKGKKSVVIDDKRDIKLINVESEPSNTRSSSYMDLYEWPWRIIISLFLIGYLFEIMAYATPYWMITSDANDNDVMSVGLWSACTTISNCTFRGDDADCLNAVRAFGGIGLLCGIVNIVLFVFQYKKLSNRSYLNRGIITNCFVAAICIQISSSVFWRSDACYYCDDTSATFIRWAWSLALALTSLLLLVVTGLSFLAIELIMISRKRASVRAWNGHGFVFT